MTEQQHSQLGSIYVLIEPQTGEIRYVGQTKVSLRRRLYLHAYRIAEVARTDHRTAWLARQVRIGYPPRIELVQSVPYPDLNAAEVYWIAYFRSIGCDLTNTHPGGNGGWISMKNRPGPRLEAKLSDATKQQISQKLSGRSLPELTKQRMSAARKRDSGKIADATRKAWNEGKFNRKRLPDLPDWYGSTTCPACGREFKNFRGISKHMTQSTCGEQVGAIGNSREYRKKLAAE